MSWEKELINFYDTNASQAGRYDSVISPNQLPIAPLFTKYCRANYEVSLTENGDFISAKTLDTKSISSKILVPTNSEVAARTSGAYNMPAPFIDQLKFMSKDNSVFDKDIKVDFYKNYMNSLLAWKNSGYTHMYLNALYMYLFKGTIIEDLRNSGLIESHEKVNSGAIVRFIISGEITWKNLEFFAIYEKYYMSLKKNNTIICPFTGEEDIPALAYSKFEGNAKLFSVNDEKNFTFRGERYNNANDVLRMGVYTEQKINAALQWIKNYQQSEGYLFWGVENMPSPWSNTKNSIIIDDEDYEDEAELELLQGNHITINSCYDWAKMYKKYINGYQAKIPEQKNINIMRTIALTSGRSSVAEYYNISVNEFYDSLKNWHIRGAWLQDKYYGVPTPRDIVIACDNERAATNRIDMLTWQLVQCMIQNMRVPFTLVKRGVKNLVLKASMIPSSNDFRCKDINIWEEKILSPVCSLVAEYYNFMIQNEGDYYTMKLDETCLDRSYLFGRLLACAHILELETTKKHKTTNAMSLANRFVDYPYPTWGILVKKINVYQAENENHGGAINRLIDDVLMSFNNQDDFTMNKCLDPIWVIGFAAQKKVLNESN